MARILVADDEPSIMLLVKAILGKKHSYIEAEDGNIAIEKLRKGPPDLAILDIMMPGKTGFEVVSFMRRTGPLKSVPVIMLSAKASEKDIMEGMKHGAQAYITKPFEPSKLEAQVNELI
jgi:two-component system, OmpR family, alkaline phosphatase synthesis response regulator PhoP